MTTKVKDKEIAKGDVGEPKEPGTAVLSAEAERMKAIAAYGGDLDLSEDIRQDEVLIPFLRLIQSNSPQVDPSSPKYIEAAKPGMILNTATGELYLAAAFAVAQRMHNYVEYVPRNSGGGFVAIWDAADERVAALRAKHGQFGKIPLESGNELTETYYWAGPVVGKRPDGSVTDIFEAVVGMASTQIKYYKQAMNRLAGLVGRPRRFPDFAFRWLLAAMPDSNKKGKFWSWRVALDGLSADDARMAPTDPMVVRARELAASLREGVKRADFAAQAATAEGGEEATSSGDDLDNEIPM